MNDFFRTLLLCLSVPSWIFGLRTLSLFLSVKESKWKKFLLSFGFWLLINMVIQVGDLVNLPPTFFIFMTSLFISCEGPVLKIFTVGLIFSCTALSFSALADNFILGLLPEPPQVTRCALLLIFWSAAYHIIRKNAPAKDYELPPALWRLICLLAFTPFCIVIAVILLTAPTSYTETATDKVYFFLLLVAFFSFTGLIWTITVLARQQKLVRQNVLLHANEKYYESIREQQFEVRRLKHDLSNHLQVLYSLPAAEKNDYIQKLLNTPVYTQTLHYSGDDTINAVLTAKKARIDHAHITFHTKIDIPRELPFDKTDTCALFANALDNAIEGCCCLDEENRMIILEAGWSKNLFVLRVSNSSKNSRIHKNILPVTSKSDKVQHGYGLRSIQEITERYGGTMEIDAGNGTFCLLLYLPASAY